MRGGVAGGLQPEVAGSLPSLLRLAGGELPRWASKLGYCGLGWVACEVFFLLLDGPTASILRLLVFGAVMTLIWSGRVAVEVVRLARSPRPAAVPDCERAEG